MKKMNSDVLRRLIKQSTGSVASFADACGIPTNRMFRMLSGNSDLNLDVVNMAAKIGVSTEHLVEMLFGTSLEATKARLEDLSTRPTLPVGGVKWSLAKAAATKAAEPKSTGSSMADSVEHLPLGKHPHASEITHGPALGVTFEQLSRSVKREREAINREAIKHRKLKEDAKAAIKYHKTKEYVTPQTKIKPNKKSRSNGPQTRSTDGSERKATPSIEVDPDAVSRFF